MSKIFIINGQAGVGKDTFIDLVAKEIGDYNVLNISTVDEVKAIAKQIGWNGVKDDKSRKFLSDLKQVLTDFNDYPIMECVKKISNFEKERYYYQVGTNKAIIFIHCREPREIDKLKRLLECQTLLIHSSRITHIPENTSDLSVFEYDYDYIIDNSKGIKELTLEAQNFIQKINLEV